MSGITWSTPRHISSVLTAVYVVYSLVSSLAGWIDGDFIDFGTWEVDELCQISNGLIYILLHHLFYTPRYVFFLFYAYYSLIFHANYNPNKLRFPQVNTSNVNFLRPNRIDGNSINRHIEEQIFNVAIFRVSGNAFIKSDLPPDLKYRAPDSKWLSDKENEGWIVVIYDSIDCMTEH